MNYEVITVKRILNACIDKKIFHNYTDNIVASDPIKVGFNAITHTCNA